MPKLQEAKKVYPHNCGQCGGGFETEAAYLEHICNSTGYKPTDPEHHGEEGKAISEAALKRGEKRKGEEVHPADAAK